MLILRYRVSGSRLLFMITLPTLGFPVMYSLAVLRRLGFSPFVPFVFVVYSMVFRFRITLPTLGFAVMYSPAVLRRLGFSPFVPFVFVVYSMVMSCRLLHLLLTPLSDR